MNQNKNKFEIGDVITHKASHMSGIILDIGKRNKWGVVMCSVYMFQGYFKQKIVRYCHSSFVGWEYTDE